ncbi:hypothetical protein PNEG_03573 [Pneumocystis murina B123]|uniref:EF-hand domain-containing protein n=1 Tax=Pneumocystis murina (strain B123) TaxID=1069680 RepID=M7P2M3_PNEMU|nr:hypothetical protein PNEG_03573 [Pneumocystis murina B123]EMR08135.1 hypothetical protein PNEG_03573 [Pneumocystis murina B123]
MDSSNVAYKEAFSLFDKYGKGTVSKECIGDLLRAVGQNPTLSEVSEIEESILDEVTFDTFLRILNRPNGFRPVSDHADFIRGFQVFDKDSTGFIGVGELKYILTNLGEKLSDDEVNELLKDVNTKDGVVNYGEFVRMILSN